MLQLGGRLNKKAHKSKSNSNYYDSGQEKLISLKFTEILYLDLGLNDKNPHKSINCPTKK